jgi:two-component system, response regulator PdtaR
MGGARGESLPVDERKTRSAILVAEDEVLIRLEIAEQLRGAGYTVIEAANAHEAIELLRHSADVKVLISDIQMPGSIDGVGLARLVRAEFPAIKIVLASGHLPAAGGVEHDGFFRKPFDIAGLVKHIKALMG